MLEAIVNYCRREPVRSAGIVRAFFGILVSFGLGLSPVQIGAVMALLETILLPATRAAVTPNKSVLFRRDEVEAFEVVDDLEAA